MRTTLRCLALLGTLLSAGCVRDIVTPEGAPVAPAPCATSAPVAHSVFLIGDAGEPRLPTRDAPELIDPVLRSLQRQVGVHAAILRASRPLVPSFFVGGHEHSLQVHRDVLGTYYLVSGAGSASKVARVEERSTMMMGAARAGYMQLDVHADGALSVTVLAIVDRDRTEPIFHHCLANGPWTAWRPPSEAPHADRTRTL